MRQHFVKDIRRMVVKVGTSVLTTDGRFDKRTVAKLSEEVSAFLKKGIQVHIVSSGAIGAGMTILKLKERPTTMEGLQAAAAIGQRYLMQCYEEAFSRYGFSTAQILLTWDDLAVRKRFLNARNTLNQILKWGLVPVINENDTVATDEIRFGDNDKLSALLSVLVEADLLVILSDTDGLYAGRDQHSKGQRIQVVERTDESVFSHVKDSKNMFTVGGMGSKLKAIQTCVTSGVAVFLASGHDEKVLTRIFNGEDVGTLFLPHGRRAQNEKEWLKNFVSHIESHGR